MTDMVAMHFPPEMIERLRAMMEELTTLWTSEDTAIHMASAFAASAITDKVCSMAGLAAPSDEEVEPQALFAISLGVGNLLATNWCCAPHAISKISMIANMAVQHAQSQHEGDQSVRASDLNTADCKGTA